MVNEQTKQRAQPKQVVLDYYIQVFLILVIATHVQK